jgi:hypothetical protein
MRYALSRHSVRAGSFVPKSAKICSNRGATMSSTKATSPAMIIPAKDPHTEKIWRASDASHGER